MELFLSWNTLKFSGASIFIFITTADDSIWLIPMITGTKHSKTQQYVHMIVFISTLQLACFLSWIICVLFGNTFKYKSLGNISSEILLQIIGVFLTWFIAIFFFVKKMLKKLRKQQQQQLQLQGLQITSEIISKTSYHTIDKEEDIELLHNDANNYNMIQDGNVMVSTTPAMKEAIATSNYQIGFVIMMTFAGAADEMFCFPSFLLGNIFSIQELSAGCLFASVGLILILLLFYNIFKPLFDFFNRIPLYAIISIFAVIQTLNLIYDIYY